jgi:hypothetical protein
MAGRDLSRLCQSVLPAGFEQLQRQLPPIQAFLDENLPDAVKGSVTLLSVTPQQIVIAANTPLVANYLRLHSTEIRQQLRETFQLEQELKFRTIPDALMRPRKQAELPRPQAVSAEAVAAIKLNAQWIEDEDLRAAMLSLADCLAADPESKPRD